MRRLGFLLLPLLSVPVEAGVDAGASVNLESNVWRLADQERAAFYRNPKAYRAAGIESPTDIYLRPYILYSRTAPGLGRSRLYLSGELYASNRRLSSAYLYADQRISLSKKTRLTLYADYRPETFIGEAERDGSPGDIAKEFVRSATAGASLSQRLRVGTVLKLTADVAAEDYTKGLNNQDSTLRTVGLSLHQRVGERWTVRSALWAQRRGAHELTILDPLTGAIAGANDISSESIRLDLSVLARVDKSTSVTVGYRITRKRYLTDNVYDLDHFDRTDTTQRTYFKLYRSLRGPWSFRASITYEDKNPSISETRFAYTNFTTSLGLGYEF